MNFVIFELFRCHPQNIFGNEISIHVQNCLDSKVWSQTQNRKVI